MTDPLHDPRCGADGLSGALGVGGTGGDGNLPCTTGLTPPCTSSTITSGGSSFAGTGVLNAILTAGVNAGTVNHGNGEVVITWTVGL